MSEEIEVYDIDGNLVKLYSPKWAEEMVTKGVFFETPPLVVEESPPEGPDPKTPRKRK